MRMSDKSRQQQILVTLTLYPHRFDQRFPQLKGTIFIVTYGRSGSTLLQNLLMSIPHCVIRGENHNLMETLWQTARRARLMHDQFASIGASKTSPWFGADLVQPDQFAAELVDLFVSHVLAPPPDARWFGFKEIRYDAFGDRLEEVLDFIASRFKYPVFVFNTRDAEQVARSSWWRDWNSEDVRRLVEQQDQRFARYCRMHPQNCFLAKYEDYTADPLALQGLFDLMGEPLPKAGLRQQLDIWLDH